MTKRRTRKAKESAKHHFTLSWQPRNQLKSEAKNTPFEADVNRQYKTSKSQSGIKSVPTKYSIKSELSVSLASIKKDIAKSLILAGFILGTEIVLYLIWH